jgi:hypothetical protein
VDLNALLAHHARTMSSHYRGDLADHAPMALRALARLGASDARLAEFYASYLPQLEPMGADETRAVDVIHKALLAHGVSSVLRIHLPRVLEGLVGGAFHGVIRVAWALAEPACDDVRELAVALVYAESEATRLFAAGRKRTPTTKDVMALLAQLQMLHLEKPTLPTIAKRMKAIASDPRVLRIVDQLHIDDDTILHTLSHTAQRLHQVADDFTSMHALTGLSAVRQLLPRAPHVDTHDVKLQLWEAFAVAYVVVGAPELPQVDEVTTSWSEIGALALASNDDHVAKYVCACEDEESATGDGIHRTLAVRTATRGFT